MVASIAAIAVSLALIGTGPLGIAVVFALIGGGCLFKHHRIGKKLKMYEYSVLIPETDPHASANTLRAESRPKDYYPNTIEDLEKAIKLEDSTELKTELEGLKDHSEFIDTLGGESPTIQKIQKSNHLIEAYSGNDSEKIASVKAELTEIITPKDQALDDSDDDLTPKK